MDVYLEPDQVRILRELIEKEIRQTGETEELEQLLRSFDNQTSWRLRFDWGVREVK